MDLENLEIKISSNDEGDHRKKTFREIISSMNLPAATKVADLGAGPCIFAKIAAEYGCSVTAVDARTERVPSAEDIAPVKFVQADIREFDLNGYDLIMIFGLLYHLEINDQLDLLSRCKQSAIKVVLDTQVHIPELVCTPEPERFTDLITTPDGYEGIKFIEGDNPMASIINPDSFWHTEQSMYKLFEKAGFEKVCVVDPAYQSKHGARRFYILE